MIRGIFFVLMTSYTLASSPKLQMPDNLRGEGQYNFFFFDVYYAKLFGPKNAQVYKEKFCLELKYLRDFKGLDIVSQSKKEMISQGVDKKLVEMNMEKMKQIFPDVKEGDRITASFVPGIGVHFYLNKDRYLGGFDDPRFSKYFMNIWLGEKTSDKELRKKLLGDI